MAADRPSGGDCGRALREARERRGVSLRQIANTTKISVSALEALERNDISRLPGGIFSRAFVRSYATEVGLDPENTVREFMAQFPGEPETASRPVSAAAPVEEAGEVESERRMATTFLWLIALSVPVAAVMLYLGMSGREAAVSTPPAPAASARPFPDAPVVPAAPEPAAPAAAASEPERIVVVLSTARPCWISVTVDGEKLVERILQPGERQTFEMRRDVVLGVGDAEALTMTLDGAEARPLGKPGQVVTTRFNLTNFKEYLASR